MPDLLPPDVQREVLESKQKAIQYDMLMKKLLAGAEWTFLMKCMRFYREGLIQAMKSAGSTSDEYLQKLIAVDVLIDLPKDIRTALGQSDSSASTDPEGSFGFVDEPVSTATSLQEGDK